MTNYEIPVDPLKGVFAGAIHSGIKSSRYDLSVYMFLMQQVQLRFLHNIILLHHVSLLPKKSKKI